MPIFGRMKIGAFAIVHGFTRIANPVHGFTPWAQLGNDRFGCMTSAQSTQLGVLPLRLSIRDVDIQQPRRFANELCLFKLGHHVFGKLGRLI